MTITTDSIPGYVSGTWKVDPDHARISFSVRHLAITKVRGTFDDFDVTLVTADDPAESTVEATIQIASVNTAQPSRDAHLRTSDFFAAEEFPQMHFRSTGFRADDDRLLIDGDLTLRGVTRPVTLVTEVGGIATDSMGQTKIGAEATTTIDRTDFGVNWNAATEAGGLTLGTIVTISIEIQLTLQK